MHSVRLVACSTALVLTLASSPVRAAIIVAGDITQHFHLTDGLPNPATAGNQQFFQNMLGSGTSVGVLGTTTNTSIAPETNDFYNGLGGVSSTILTGTLTGGDLAGLDMLLLPAPDDNFLVSELTAIVDFVNGGGTLYVAGEAVFGAAVNSRVNAVLAALGSSMSVDNSVLDIGPQVASGAQIGRSPTDDGCHVAQLRSDVDRLGGNVAVLHAERQSVRRG